MREPDAAKTARTVDRIVDGARVAEAVDDAVDAAKLTDKISDTVKLTGDVADTAKAMDKTSDAIDVASGADDFIIKPKGNMSDAEWADEVARAIKQIPDPIRTAERAPVKIPKTATFTKQVKENGYLQIKYQWQEGDYIYTGRWHTRPPTSPKEQRITWVVERHRTGIGYGKQQRGSIREVLVGEDKWVPKTAWKKAIGARKSNTITKEQDEMLYNGHWEDHK